MPRPSLPYGTWGTISVTRVGPSRYNARARFSGTAGIRQVARYGQTKSDARQRLLEALAHEREAAHAGTVDRGTTVGELADHWIAANEQTWRPNTAETYRAVVANEIKPNLGGLRIGDLRPPVVNMALQRVLVERGPGSAKTTRTVLSGIARFAVANGALAANPVREATAVPRPRCMPRALTREQAEELCDRLRTDTRAVDLDLPDLVDWGLGTACRIGEALAARHDVNGDGEQLLDRKAGTWEVNATLIRITGTGLTIQDGPKTAAGWRRLALPSYLLAMLDRRATEARLSPTTPVIFPSPHAKTLRDPRNTARELREAVTRAGYPWVHFHTFRKSALTWLLDAGVPPRVVADIAGHSRPSMTLDVYQHRQVVSADAARILDR